MATGVKGVRMESLGFFCFFWCWDLFHFVALQFPCGRDAVSVVLGALAPIFSALSHFRLGLASIFLSFILSFWKNVWIFRELSIHVVLLLT